MSRALTAILIVAVSVVSCLAAPAAEPEPVASPEPKFANEQYSGPLLVVRLLYAILALVGNLLVVLLEDLLNGGIIPKQLLELVYNLLPFALNNG